MLFGSDNSLNQKPLKEYEIMCFPNKKKNFGNFTGDTPKKAAEKAFTLLSNITQDEIKKDGVFIVFSIRKKNKSTNKSTNTTANTTANTNKEHKYIGTVIELENKVVNNQKTLKYKNVISKYNSDLDKIDAKNKNIRYNLPR